MTTSSGHEAHSARRIDVEANLLDIWISERRQATRRILSWGFAMAAFLALTGWALVRFVGTISEYSRQTAAISLRIDQLPAATSGPSIEDQAAVSRAQSTRAMDLLQSALNSAPNSVSLTVVTVDQSGLACEGEADSVATVAAFSSAIGGADRTSIDRGGRLGVIFRISKISGGLK